MIYLGLLVGKIEKRPEVEEQRAKERALAQDVPEGRGTHLVEVLKVELKQYDQFDAGRLVVTCKAVEGGFVLWGTLPSSCSEARRGDRMELTATVAKSDRDPKFGFFKRPCGRLLVALSPEAT